MTTIADEQVESFSLDLNPTIPLAVQIRRGDYNYVDPAITVPRNFDLTVPVGHREVVLYRSLRFVYSEEVIARMQADGCVPGTLDDALALGQQFPDCQCQNRIVFLGTAWRVADNGHLVPILGWWPGGREFYLDWSDNGWPGEWLFAAVK